jgi:lipopolysaccharide transport system permease protein
VRSDLDVGRRRVLDLAFVLVDRDLRLSYGGAAFGLFWAPMTVIVQVVVLGFVFDRVVPLGVDDYPVFLFSGLAAWHLLSTALGGSSEAFTMNRDLVRRPGFPDAVLPLVAVTRSVATYLLGLPVLLVALVVAGRLEAPAVALPLVVVGATVLAAGPALVIATLQVRFRDVAHAVRVGLGVVFYAVPVFYDADRLPERFEWLADANPLAAVVMLHRQVLYDGEWPDLGRVAFVFVAGAIGLVVGTAVFRREHGHLADEL